MSTQNSQLPAFANPGSEQGPGSTGMTKREFAIFTIAAGLADRSITASYIVSSAMKIADEIFKRLEEETK